jgi:hypothetical protein
MPIETNCTSPRLMRLDRLHAVHCRSLPAQEVQALLDYCVTSERRPGADNWDTAQVSVDNLTRRRQRQCESPPSWLRSF